MGASSYPVLQTKIDFAKIKEGGDLAQLIEYTRRHGLSPQHCVNPGMVVTSASIPSLGRWKQGDQKGKVILGYTFMWLEFPEAIIIITIHLTLPLGLLQAPPRLGVEAHFHLVQAYSLTGLGLPSWVGLTC